MDSEAVLLSTLVLRARQGASLGTAVADREGARMLRQLFDAESSTYTYLVYDPEAGIAALIDPVIEQVERDLRLVAELDLRLAFVLDTHVHADHVTAAGTLRERTGATTAASARGAPCVDRMLQPGDVITIGDIALHVLATPGHTDDHLSYYVPSHAAVFTGDTLLVRGCGRTDFQNGDARTLYRSVHDVLFTLPDATTVYPGHDYKGHTTTTIAEEKRHNPRLGQANGTDEDGFVALMAALQLPRPKLIDLAVPANRACGRPPQST